MHELGIVFALIDTLEDTAAEHNLTSIQKVTVDLGEVSGVVTAFFTDAWEWASDKHDLLRGAELEICTIPAVTVCNECGRTYPTVEYGRTCPYCKSPHTELLHGNELEIRSIEAE